MIRVVVVDDQALVRAGLRALLDGATEDVQILAEASTADEAVALCAAHDVDLVLMDLRFGDGRTGVEATREIRALPDPPHVLVVTNYDTDAEILRAIEAGASGYLLKDTPPVELLAAVKAAAAGDSALSPTVASKLMSRMRDPVPGLTPRELQVLGAVAAGSSNLEIAREIFLSEATVKSHLVQVFAKLDVRSRTAAVARARERGLIAAD